MLGAKIIQVKMMIENENEKNLFCLKCRKSDGYRRLLGWMCKGEMNNLRINKHLLKTVEECP